MLCEIEIGALICDQRGKERCSFYHKKILEIGDSPYFVMKKKIVKKFLG